jgi:hypothetical protein
MNRKQILAVALCTLTYVAVAVACAPAAEEPPVNKAAVVKENPQKRTKTSPLALPAGLPVLAPHKGILGVAFPAEEAVLDLTLGMDVMTVADPLGMDIGEHDTPVRGAPRSLGYGDTTMEFDAAGKLVALKVALADLPRGLAVGGVHLPADASLADLARLVPGCTSGEERVACSGFFASAHQGRVSLHISSTR